MLLNIDPDALARAMSNDNYGSAIRSAKARKREAKQQRALLLHRTERLGRKFNHFVMSFKKRDREPWDCCFYCGDELHIDNRTKDHIYPKCLGGKVVVPCCAGCNKRKKNWLLDEFRVKVFGKGFVFWGEGVVIRELGKL